MAASLRAAAATRILRLPGVLPGEGLRRLVHTNQSAPARALEEGYRGTQIQQKKEELYVASQLDRRPMTTAKKVTAFVCVAGAITLGAFALGDGAEDWPPCPRCGKPLVPRKCAKCGRNLPRPSAEAMQAASEYGQVSGAAQNQKGTA